MGIPTPISFQNKIPPGLIKWPYQNDDHVILEGLLANPVFNVFYSSQSKPKKIRMESYTNFGFRRALRTVTCSVHFWN